MTVKSVQLITNSLRYGPCPEATDAIEQRLSISSNGRVWFSEKNYEQYFAGKGLCRKKQLSIGAWKAKFLINQFTRIPEQELIKDCGTYELIIRNVNGDIQKMYGSLECDPQDPSYGFLQRLTRLIRRTIPVSDLWGFDFDLTPDYDGKEKIYLFADKWQQRFTSGELSDRVFEDHFGEECRDLGFQMDCGHEFAKLYPNCARMDSENLEACIGKVQDVDLLGSAVYSQWRFLTHWCQYELDDRTCSWFLTLLAQMKRRCKR